MPRQARLVPWSPRQCAKCFCTGCGCRERWRTTEPLRHSAGTSGEASGERSIATGISCRPRVAIDEEGRAKAQPLFLQPGKVPFMDQVLNRVGLLGADHM